MSQPVIEPVISPEHTLYQLSYWDFDFLTADIFAESRICDALCSPEHTPYWLSYWNFYFVTADSFAESRIGDALCLFTVVSFIYAHHIIKFASISKNKVIINLTELTAYNSNSSSLCLFRVIWLAGEEVLHFDKFHEQESWNYFPSATS